MEKVTEQMLASQDVRKNLIEGFDQLANQQRKGEAFKAYECLKDKTHYYVLDLLLRQFDLETVTEMQYAISNISILRKVIEKLAKVYAQGAKRTGSSDAETKAVEALAKEFKFDQVMTKCNRYFRTFKNALIYVKPLKVEDKFSLKLEVLPPFKYDVVPDPDNPELPLAIVLSDYVPKRKTLYTLGDAARAGRGAQIRELEQPYDGPAHLTSSFASTTGNTPQTGGQDNGEKDARRFIWWTKNLHFTTNSKGEIIQASEEGNPILTLPFVNFAGDQDGEFFAQGGEDLVDSGVKINTMISNLRHVAISQGYGQLYMTGKNLPKAVKVGPNHCVQLEVDDKEDPQPQVGYLNSNPPIAELQGLVEMDVALMLTTNNLSTSGFSTSLKGAKDFASGIALMIDKSESIEDVEEQAKIFIEREPKVWSLITKWTEVYASRKLLADQLVALPVPKEPEKILVAFPPQKPMTSELEELQAIQMRRDLGLNTEVELLMRDDPSLSEEEAQTKLDKIGEEKQKRMQDAVDSMGAMNGNPGQEGNGNPNQNGDNPGSAGARGPAGPGGKQG